MNLDFSNPLSDFLDADARVPGTLASMLKFKLDINVSFRKYDVYLALSGVGYICDVLSTLR